MTSIALKVAHRLPLIAAVTGLALVGALSGVAAAGPPYTVKVKVVKPTVPLGSPFTVVASGVSANTSVLVIYINTIEKCKKTGKADSLVPTNQLTFATTVVGAYTESASEVAQNVGVHYACAYLHSVVPPAPAMLRARAGASYQVTSATG